MLKITRRAGERIMVGDEIVITLIEVSGGTARLGIEAPRAIPVYREEIWVEVKRENEAVAGAAGTTLPAVAAGASPPATTPAVTLTSDS